MLYIYCIASWKSSCGYNFSTATEQRWYFVLMSVGFTSILTTFIVIFILLRNKAAPLDHRVRELVSRLGLCRRGCRAGAHYRRLLLAARSVTSSTSRTGTAGGNPNHQWPPLCKQRSADTVASWRLRVSVQRSERQCAAVVGLHRAFRASYWVLTNGISYVVVSCGARVNDSTDSMSSVFDLVFPAGGLTRTQVYNRL